MKVENDNDVAHKVEKLWLTPMEGKDGRCMAAFILAQPDLHDLSDMEEEAVLSFKCEDGLFVLGKGGGCVCGVFCPPMALPWPTKTSWMLSSVSARP